MGSVLPFLTDVKQEQESISHATSKWIEYVCHCIMSMYCIFQVVACPHFGWQIPSFIPVCDFFKMLVTSVC